MRKRLFLLAAIGICITLFAQQPAWQPDPSLTTLPLWPNAAPGAPANPAPEKTTVRPGGPIPGRTIIVLDNVYTPTLTVYPPKAANTGVAIAVFPGGAYRMLAIDIEGTEVCNWLNSLGITCVLVKYRVPDSGPYPKFSGALQDAQRTVGIIRAHAADWHIDPHRVGVLGFSAGAHLSAALSTHFDQRVYEPIDDADQLSCRPDFAMILYPGLIGLKEQNFAPSPDIIPTDKTPPAFIAQTEFDGVGVENSIDYFLALKKVKIPAEMHLYGEAGHGYGVRSAASVGAWPKAAEIWLHTIKILPSTAP
jgi:acetyl esterase/lipase